MTVTNLTGSSYGVFPPMKEGHVTVCIVLMLSGTIFIDYVMGIRSVFIEKITSND